MALTEKQRAYVRGAVRRWNIKTGAVRSGKTWLDVHWTIPRRVLDAPEGGLVVIMGNTQETVRRNIIEPMRQVWPETAVGQVRADGMVRLFGRDAFVLGADTKDRVKAIQGASFAYCYGDEVTTWAREVFEMVKSRLDRAGSRFDGTCNPAGPGHWFKAFLQSGADVFQQAYTIDDNPHLPGKFVADLKAEYGQGALYDRYILGKWTQAEGLVYPGFAAARHVAEAAEGVQRIVFGCDVGHANATAFVAVGGGRYGPVWVLDEYYHSGRAAGKAKSPLGYARDFVAFRDRVMAAWPGAAMGGVYVDPSAAGFIAMLREVGVQRVYRARNDVDRGIAAVAARLDGGGLKVLAGCRMCVEEFAGYVWDESAAARGEDRPVKAGDHCMDAIRYAVMGWR